MQTLFKHKYLFYSIKMAYPPKQVLHSASTQRHSTFFFCLYDHLTSLWMCLPEKNKNIKIVAYRDIHS